MRRGQDRLTFSVVLLVVAILSSLAVLCAQTNANQKGVSVAPRPVRSGHGRYVALVIGINNYPNFPKLKTPINDAEAVAEILREPYGFKVELLLDANATRDQVLETLDRYRQQLGEDDNLLIYYAGHGFYDPQMRVAYWAPVDARQDTYSHWIIATEITSRARAIHARHVLVVSDSCYSGMFNTKGADSAVITPIERGRFLDRIAEGRSRHLMSSGGNEPVADCDPSGSCVHSLFAQALLQGLGHMPFDRFAAKELFDKYVMVQVPGRSKQMPEYSPIEELGPEDGDFVFLRKSDDPNRAVQQDPEPTLHPQSAKDPEREAVGAALDRYTDAYSSFDIEVMKQAWPTLSKGQIRQIEDGWKRFRAVKVELRNPTTTLFGATAKVACDQWMVYTREGTRQPPQVDSVEIVLKKDKGGWVVNNVCGSHDLKKCHEKIGMIND